MKLNKLRYLIVAAVLLAVIWLGYWIGYMSSMPAPGKASLENNMMGDRLVHGKELSNNVFVVDAKPHQNNVPINNGQDINAVDHALRIHKGHARQISDSINAPQIHSNNPVRNTNVKGFGAPGKVGNNSETNAGNDNAFHEFLGFDNAGSNGKVNLPNVKVAKAGPVATKRQPLLPAGENVKEHQHREPHEADNNRQKHIPGHFLGEKDSSQVKMNEIPVEDTDGGNAGYYTLLHSDRASRVHGKIHAKLKSLPDNVPTDAYVLTSKALPKEVSARPSIGNGYLATMIHAKEVYMQGLYSGPGSESHRAIIPSTCSFNITHTDPPTKYVRTYKLNVGEGIYSEVSKYSTYNLTHRIFAHRKIKHLLVVEVDLERSEIFSPLTLQIQLNRWVASYDITFTSQEPVMEKVSYKKGTINAPEHSAAQYDEVHVLYDHVPDKLVAPSDVYRTKWVFLSSIASRFEDALDAYKHGRELMHGIDDLYGSHVREWANLWSTGRVDIEGNVKVAQNVYASLYYMLSSMPLENDPYVPFVGLSPHGLPLGKFLEMHQGHIMWDQEMWMYPSLLLLHQDMGRLILLSRQYTHKIAKANVGKDKGFQYPTESGATGIELSANPEVSSRCYHVTGMVSLAIIQYLYATRDASVLETHHLLDILVDVAEFWPDKLSFNNKDQMYDLKGVNPPDLSHPGVNNPAFTVALAQITMGAPRYALSLKNITIPNRFQQFTESMRVPYDVRASYHPAFDGYTQGTPVYQADSVLLGYPLLWEMTREERENDLRAYVKSTDPQAPSTAWAMYTVGWLEVGEMEQAHVSFLKQLDYVQNEFKVWSNRTMGGTMNYLSGMGAFLQSVINGYGGFRLRNDHLDFNPVLPHDCTGVNFISVDYLGASIDFYVRQDDILVTMTSRAESATRLILYMYEPEEVLDLVVNQSVRVKRRKGAILAANMKYPEEL